MRREENMKGEKTRGEARRVKEKRGEERSKKQ